MTRLGRNDVCHCGSRRKYKVCCLEKDRMAQITDLGARDEQGYLVGRPTIDAIWQGKRVRAIGDQVAIRPEHETEQEFFVHGLASILGDAWRRSQDALEAGERHPVASWLAEWEEIRRTNGEGALEMRDEGGGTYSTAPTGNLKALIALATDVYSLRHAFALSTDDSIVKRMRNREQFQGARYELAVAAMMVRAGYSVEWITDTSRKLPEFISRRDEVEMVVEAKSRPRPGVLGRPGERPEKDELTADVSRLLREALEKETDGRPFVVFLDLNLPPGGETPTEESLKRLHDGAMAWRGEASLENPDPFSLVIVTNFSWHWSGASPAPGAERAIVIPIHAAVPLPTRDAFRIWEAVEQYDHPPERPSRPSR